MSKDLTTILLAGLKLKITNLVVLEIDDKLMISGYIL